MPITDIAIHESGTGGDFTLIGGDIETIKGITNQVYLALFGGNYEQSTSADVANQKERFDWWGNNYLAPENQFNSSFERTINDITLNSAGINRLVGAAKKDLQFLSDYADIEVSGSIVGINRFELQVILKEPDKKTTKIVFLWDGTKNEIIQNEIL